MAHINPVWPNDGDPGWGDTLNTNFDTVTGQINSHDDQIAALAGSSSSVPSATTTAQGVVQLAGDLTGIAGAPTLRNIITAGSVGSTSTIPVITYDAKGRITAATTVAAPTGGGTSSSNVTLLAGTGIDPTGVTDSQAAVQAILSAAVDGTTIVVPDGAIIRCNSGLTVAHRITFGGAGTINFYNLNGSGHIAAVLITANGAKLIGLNIGNPSKTVPDNTSGNGNSQFGILIEANDVLVAGCVVDKFQSGIVVDSHGEYERTRIMYNRVSDVLGAGGGPTDVTHNGEDRGDGICNWGDQATIVGNIVNCIAGGDARIGIHTEALGPQEAVATAYSDSMVTISGNIVTGQFRRGIAAEGVSRVAITGNTVMDSTWWCIAFIGNAQNGLIVGNTINWTRTATDNQGQSNTPTRTPIMLYINTVDLHGPVVANNTIHIASGSTTSGGIRSAGDGVHTIYDAIVEGNTIWDESGTMPDAIRFSQFAIRPKITGNTVNFFQSTGVYIGNGNEVSITNNALVGAGSTDTGSRGIQFAAAGTGWQVNGNTITDCDTGIYCVNGTEVQVNSNRFARTITGIYGSGTTAPFVIVGNLFNSVTTPYLSVTGNAVLAGNSN